MQKILIDINDNAFPPAGFMVIETEVTFLEKACSQESLFIRGQHLCMWAQKFYQGRQMNFGNAPSPIQDMINTFPELAEEQARKIFGLLGNDVSKLARISAADLLNIQYPMTLWEEIPSAIHAAKWLIWLDQTAYHELLIPLFKYIGAEWSSLQPNLAPLYDCYGPETARVIIGQWIDVLNVEFRKKYGDFPLPIPERWLKHLEKTWRKQVIETDGEFLTEFIKHSTPMEFKKLVALATLDYYEQKNSPRQITTERLNQIARFVSGNGLIRLNLLKAAQPPRDVPDSPDAVLKWFEDEYLPFRAWQISAKADAPNILDLGLQFAMWYLSFYPTALTSKKYLSFFKSKNLKDQKSEYVDLLVILDGLHTFDAKFLKDCLLSTNGSHKLEITDNTFCFAPLPTVTDFAKGALVHGAQPTLMKELQLLGDDVSELNSPLEKLKAAQPGSLLIWRFQDPDRTYHTKNRSPLLKTEVEGELTTIAQKILDVTESLSLKTKLRITITTDHGRFLGMSKRIMDIPDGMQAHGRAAWGRVELSFDKTGYKIVNNIAYLSKDRFGLMDEDAAVILDDTAFKHPTYSQEYSTHGGLFPEEVIIPWMVFEREIVRPELAFTISGEGQATFPGMVKFEVVNSSSVNLKLVKVMFVLGLGNSFEITQQEELPGFRKTPFEINIPTWPSSEQVALGKAEVYLCLPNGEEYSVSTSLSDLKIAEFYKRDTSFLEGLDL